MGDASLYVASHCFNYKIQVATATPVTERISTVGCDINLDEPVALRVILSQQQADLLSIFLEHDDAVEKYLHQFHLQLQIIPKLSTPGLLFLMVKLWSPS